MLTKKPALGPQTIGKVQLGEEVDTVKLAEIAGRKFTHQIHNHTGT